MSTVGKSKRIEIQRRVVDVVENLSIQTIVRHIAMPATLLSAYVVALSLVPVEWRLRTLNTLARVVGALDGNLSLRDRGGRSSTSDAALEPVHIH